MLAQVYEQLTNIVKCFNGTNRRYFLLPKSTINKCTGSFTKSCTGNSLQCQPKVQILISADSTKTDCEVAMMGKLIFCLSC